MSLYDLASPRGIKEMQEYDYGFANSCLGTPSIALNTY